MVNTHLVMSANWVESGDDGKDDQRAPGPHPITGAYHSSSHALSRPYLESRPSLARAMSLPVSTPHDIVLAELLAQRPSSVKNDNEGPETASLKHENVADDDRRRVGSQNYEVLHDPFTGSIIGLSAPEEREHNEVGDFESAKDELWAHMARIRTVQSEIANLHVMMEGVGPGPPGEQGAAGRSVPIVHPTEGDKWEDEEGDEEVEEKNAREREFARLAEKFNGRKEATANIINKVRSF
jgi:hypothetical protein